ncbi:hypothetical protein [Deinococcus sonorensis]|uniref:TIGR04222 domain-containing membrane protein n=2 Tax=Deinococcus sonorensis TaxID=309891 RepID=A0AAU7UBB8_9DEIO
MNGIHHPALLAQLEQYVFPPAFVMRLQSEQGWSSARTQAVLVEYRRFVYLAATSAQPVTPSGPVDEVWHTHLTFTRDYWERLCGEVLGRPLHHEPGTGTADEAFTFARQYEATLQLYADTFGQPAPVEVWPAPRPQAAVPAPAVRGSVSSLQVLLGLLAGGLAFALSGHHIAVAVLVFGVVLVLLASRPLRRARRALADWDGPIWLWGSDGTADASGHHHHHGSHDGGHHGGGHDSGSSSDGGSSCGSSSCGSSCGSS